MAAERDIKIPRLVWLRLVTDLARRGKGRRETGAFLLGKAAGDNRVEAFVCYDDLDPHALSGGIVAFHARGFSALWELCAKKGLKVLADAHTHPTHDVCQSRVDRNHPMIPVQGHIALILPNYGRTSKWSLDGVGIHVFRGQSRWDSFGAEQHDTPVRLCTW
ncbi:hypothetical protein HI808_03195 [Ralstonia solanacearum]|nr:hypothetical protein HI812_03195 [Ralstonia solanacearum]QKL65533.1 hypothetical protein HI808_03195 [Ralstonia solanacearum]